MEPAVGIATKAYEASKNLLSVLLNIRFKEHAKSTAAKALQRNMVLGVALVLALGVLFSSPLYESYGIPLLLRWNNEEFNAQRSSKSLESAKAKILNCISSKEHREAESKHYCRMADEIYISIRDKLLPTTLSTEIDEVQSKHLYRSMVQHVELAMSWHFDIDIFSRIYSGHSLLLRWSPVLSLVILILALSFVAYGRYLLKSENAPSPKRTPMPRRKTNRVILILPRPYQLGGTRKTLTVAYR